MPGVQSRRFSLAVLLSDWTLFPGSVIMPFRGRPSIDGQIDGGGIETAVVSVRVALADISENGKAYAYGL